MSREGVGGKREEEEAEEEVELGEREALFSRQRERSISTSLAVSFFLPFLGIAFSTPKASPIASETIARTLSSITSSATLGGAVEGASGEGS